MKKLITFLLTLVFITLISVRLSAQDDYVMFLSIALDPIPGKSVELVKGVQEHNAAYHTEGESKAYLWAIVTGPRSGQYAWAQGPMKYAKMDEGLSDAHNADWASKVMANCRNNEQIRMFRRLDDHSYNPANEVVGTNVLARIFYNVNDRGTLLEGMMKIKETLAAKKRDYARRVYVSDFQGQEREDVMLIYPFEKWSGMETRRGLESDFGKVFDEVHGAGSWEKTTAKLAESSDGWYDEIRVMVK